MCDATDVNMIRIFKLTMVTGVCAAEPGVVAAVAYPNSIIDCGLGLAGCGVLKFSNGMLIIAQVDNTEQTTPELDNVPEGSYSVVYRGSYTCAACLA